MDRPDGLERRGGPDRRRVPRGGRRPTDGVGFAPLVMVVDPDHQRRDLTEAILAKLRFAVAPVDSVQKAISIAHALRPSVIVCGPDEVSRLHQGLRLGVPVVAVQPDVAITDALVDVVRASIRGEPV